MMPEQISLNYSVDGVAPAANHTFDKRAHELNRAVYRKTTVVADPGLPDCVITLGTTDAKASKAFPGTRRATVNVRREYLVEGPLGSSTQVTVLKGESSFPVGTPSPIIDSSIALYRAFVNSDEFVRLVKSLET